MSEETLQQLIDLQLLIDNVAKTPEIEVHIYYEIVIKNILKENV
jgi:hypothetical protein